MVEPNVKLGHNVRIFDENLVNIYGCELDDDTFVGPFVEITAGVKVGKRCKIESHSFLCDGVELEDDVFIGHGTMFTNDSYPKVDRQIQRFHTLIKRYASIGTNATIIGGIVVGVHAIVGAGTIVNRNVPDYAIVAGNPVRVLKQFTSSEELIDYIQRRQPLRQRD